MNEKAIVPVLTLLFDGLTEDQIAAKVVEELGTDTAIKVVWSMISKLPMAATSSVDKNDIVFQLSDGMYGSDAGPLELTCTDQQLATLIHEVTQSRWDRHHETITDAVLDALVAKDGYTRQIPEEKS